MTDQLPGLRERKKADTRRALSDAALDLAFAHGLDNVTREEIAAAAGVSVRTFTNYFNGKYEALAYRQTERLRRGLAVLRSRPPEEPLWAALEHALLDPLEADYDDVYGEEHQAPSGQELIEVRKLLMNSSVRNAVPRELFDEWRAAIAERTGTDPDRDLYPSLVLSVMRAIGEASAEAYVRADPPVPVTGLMRAAFAHVRDGLPEPPRKKK